MPPLALIQGKPTWPRPPLPDLSHHHHRQARPPGRAFLWAPLRYASYARYGWPVTARGRAVTGLYARYVRYGKKRVRVEVTEATDLVTGPDHQVVICHLPDVARPGVGFLRPGEGQRALFGGTFWGILRYLLP